MNERAMSRILAMTLLLVLLAASFVVVPRIVVAQRLAPAATTFGGPVSEAGGRFSYEGRLALKGQPANGPYDFKFRLYGDSTGGDVLGSEQTARAVRVRDGAFAVSLDFGDVRDDIGPYLEISVRPAGGEAAFTTLSPRQAVSLAAAGDVKAAVTAREVWRLGFTREGSVDYSAVIGRVAGDVAAFRSQQAPDIYYIFPAPAASKTIQSAHFYLLSRTGSYGGSATLALEVIRFDGALQHTASSGSIDLAAAAASAWTGVALSGTADDLVVDAGEFLAFHFHLDGAAGGDLDVRPMFEVEVQ